MQNNPSAGCSEEKQSSVIPALLLSEKDNVATLLAPGKKLDFVHVSSGSYKIFLLDDIPLHHKIALRDIRTGESVIKYGVVIGEATADISAGSWVHLHNLRSLLDEKSSALDLHTGVDATRCYE